MRTRHIFFSSAVLFLFPAFLLAAPPANAVKFIIQKPNDGIVGTPITITIEALKSNNKVDTSYQNDVTFVVSGSATGGGLVDIVNGVGTRDINDLVAETITLSLLDTQSTGLDVSSTRSVTFAASGGGGVKAPLLDQADFWFRDDDGTETTATGYGSSDINKDTNITDVARGAGVRLRFGIKDTNADGAVTPRLEFKEGTGCAGGAWTTITGTSNTFQLVASPNFTDGDPTTKQITSGQFVAGKMLESTNPASSVSVLKNNSTEYEWSFTVADDVAFGAAYSFRTSNNGTALDSYGECPSLVIQSAPATSAGNGGSVPPTVVSFSGSAFPGGKIFVVDHDVRFDKLLAQDSITEKDGTFRVNFVGVVQGNHSFGLIIKDPENRTTQTKFFNVDTISNSLTVKEILAPPTVDFTHSVVSRGTAITIVGYASPGHIVRIEIDDKIKKEATADAAGLYKLELGTGDLDFGPHRVRARQADERGTNASDLSPLATFVVSRVSLPKADLSGDGVVDIKDWSIFLSRWLSRDSTNRQEIDLNSDGKINIEDFSIFIRTIRKR